MTRSPPVPRSRALTGEAMPLYDGGQRIHAFCYVAD
jgi:hypothetical protein